MSIRMIKMKEPHDNIIFTCKDCSDDMYPLKGKFSAETIKKARAAKFLFGDLDDKDAALEHMWLCDLDVSGDIVTGKLDNDPVYVDNVILGQVVSRKISDVEELLFD